MENNLLEKLREDIDLIDKTQNTLLATVSTNTDTIIAINENMLFTTTAENEKNIITISGITVIDELKVNRIAINDTLTEEKNGEDVNTASIGTVEIPVGETEIIVETTAIEMGGRVFVTLVSEMSGNTFYVEKDFDNQKFTIIIDHSLDSIVEFDWFLIN